MGRAHDAGRDSAGPPSRVRPEPVVSLLPDMGDDEMRVAERVAVERSGDASSYLFGRCMAVLLSEGVGFGLGLCRA